MCSTGEIIKCKCTVLTEIWLGLSKIVDFLTTVMKMKQQNTKYLQVMPTVVQTSHNCENGNIIKDKIDILTLIGLDCSSFQPLA